MSFSFNPLTPQETALYSSLDKDSIDFLMTRYNRVNRWVIADMIRRTSYHYPNKTALIFKDRSLTYAELEAESRHGSFEGNKTSMNLLPWGGQSW